MSGTRLAMEWHAGWLTAVMVGSEKGRPRLGPGLCTKLPDGMAASDSHAVGEWVGEQIRQAGLGGKPVTWVAGRGDLLLKRLSLPKPPQDNQLPGMVRLQMSRAMPVQGTDAATDFVVLRDDGGTLDLLGASVPAERLVWMRSMLGAAKLKLGSVVLRAQCSGCIAGLPDAGHARIVVSPGASSVEVVVVEPGGVVTSRGIDATWPSGEQEGFVRRIAVEVKRTWMGYRAAQHSLPVESAVVIGGSGLCSAIAEAVAEVIEAEATAMPADSFAIVDAANTADPTRWLPLSGVGVAACDRIDLLNPTKAKAERSQMRERVLLGAMAAIAVFGGVGLFGFISLGDLKADAERLRTQNKRLQGDYSEMVLKSTRLEHLRALRASRPEWSGHLDRVLEHAAASGVRIEHLSGSSNGGVWFGDPDGSRSYSFADGEYRPAVRGELSVQGIGEHRELAGMVRGRLVNDPLYTVHTQGPDAGPSFKLEVDTSVRSVPVEGEQAAEPVEGMEAGTEPELGGEP
ncbi:MAG: hypothetical protein NCW75_10895 [Phycisphaera sp.]|nr:MAG: hypothetical protein NCW75_10895 [Phycisphaera sp.]